MKIVFLCSGGGGNLRFVAKALELGWLSGANLAAVLCDRECDAKTFAQSRSIPTEVLDFSAAGQPEVARRLRALAPDLIVTTVHKVLVPELVREFAGRLINLHYALLPAFGAKIGNRPLREALSYGAKFVGITVHLVDEGVDTGRPQLQAATATPERPDLDALTDALFRAGCIGLLNVIEQHHPAPSGPHLPRVQCAQIGAQRFEFNPWVRIDESLLEDRGWDFLK